MSARGFAHCSHDVTSMDESEHREMTYFWSSSKHVEHFGGLQNCWQLVLLSGDCDVQVVIVYWENEESNIKEMNIPSLFHKDCEINHQNSEWESSS